MASKKRDIYNLKSIKDELNSYNSDVCNLVAKEQTIVNKAFFYFLEEYRREDFISELERTKYSRLELNELKTLFSMYNEDNFDLNTVRKLVRAVNHIDEANKYEKECGDTLFKKIGSKGF